jgi:LPPG:FO 2-phospho-L-lactate transferase
MRQPVNDPAADGRVVVLAGGVGGAKLGAGLQAVVGARVSVVVNTGDDLERHGLAIWPDHDTVLYTLAGLDDRERGWGLRDETWSASAQLERLGEKTWFRLGDRDLATHIVRTARLRTGARPTTVARELGHALGVAATILPMTDEPVRTQVRTDDGWLEFQEYFVRRRHEPVVREIRFDGIDAARPTPEVLDALATADAIVVAPSNPFVSVAPILAVPGLADALASRRAQGAPVVAISPIVGGRALKGPADRMLASLGAEPSALGVARRYAGWLDGFVLDELDRALETEIAALGLATLVTDTVMTDDESRRRLATGTLELARRLTPVGAR